LTLATRARQDERDPRLSERLSASLGVLGKESWRVVLEASSASSALPITELLPEMAMVAGPSTGFSLSTSIR
jgi:hypothetical protein